VYPTKKQTGGELLELIQLAARSFPRVMLYAEHSIAAVDYPLLAGAAAVVKRRDPLETVHTTGVRWSGPVRVNGKLWPAADDEVVWVPAGRHRIEAAAAPPPLRLLHLTGELLDARVVENGIEFDYRSASRVAALLDAPPARVEIDGQPASPPRWDTTSHVALLLPAGRRTARVLR
jgi:hypothetical protein